MSGWASSGWICRRGFKLYEMGRLSLGQAATLAGYSKAGFMELLGKLGVPVFDYPPEELREESRAWPTGRWQTSTCLIALERIGHLHLLSRVFAEILAPPVRAELGVAPEWLRVQRPSDRAVVAALATQLGEGRPLRSPA